KQKQAKANKGHQPTMRIMKYLITAALGIASLASHGVAAPAGDYEVLKGSSSILLMKPFVSGGEFRIPGVLYFDATGCLAWKNFGMADGWQEQFPSSNPALTACENDVDEALTHLRDEGLTFPDDVA